MRSRRFASPLLLLGMSLLLAACGTNPYSLPKIESADPEYSEPDVPTAPSTPAPAPTEASRPAPSLAHAGLLAQADAARSSGDYAASLAHLERAQRIDPDDAEIYLGLAQTHAAAGNPEQARATAERGLLYCNGDRQCDALRAFTR